MNHEMIFKPVNVLLGVFLLWFHFIHQCFFIFIIHNKEEIDVMENSELYVFFHFAVCNKNKLFPLGLNYSNESL